MESRDSQQAAQGGERYCLCCQKLGHRTDECESTHGRNTPEDREITRLCNAAHALTAAQAAQVTDEMRSAVRWAPSSAYWSERLREFFGPEAREGIDALERQISTLTAAQAEQARPLTDGDMAGLETFMRALRMEFMEAFSRRIPALANHEQWCGWPGTSAFADVAISVLLANGIGTEGGTNG